MAVATPVYAQVHTVDPITGTTTFSDDVVINGKLQNASTGSNPLTLTTTIAPTPALGDINSLTMTFSTLSAAYGDASAQTRGLGVTMETDTSANGYPGILNAFIARVNLNTTGSTIGKVEAVSGVVNIKAGSTGDLASGGYATDGEYLHNSTQTITGTQRAVQGSFQINSSGSFTTAYGGEFVCTDTLGQTGTYTNLGQGVRGYVEHNATTTWANAATGAAGEVFQVGAGTITGITTGVQGWIHNTGNATFTGVVNALWGLTAITGAAVTSSGVYGAFANLTFAGTAAGGSTNAALNAEIRWTSSTNPAQNLNAMIARWRVENATITTVGKAIGLAILAPVVTNTGAAVITNAYGIQINNQGTAASATSTALRIEAQSGSGTKSYAINSLGGINAFTGDVVLAGTGTTMTTGFNYLPAGAGAPTGVPTNYVVNVSVPMYYDSTNNFLYIYSGGAWKKSTVYA